MGYGISFVLEEGYLFNHLWNDFSEPFKNLIETVDVKVDFAWLENHISNRERMMGDVHVFFSPNAEDFIMLDLYFGSSDHSGMVVLGVHADTSKKDSIEEAMGQIYNNSYCYEMRIKFNTWHGDELKHGIDVSKFPRLQESYLQRVFYHKS